MDLARKIRHMEVIDVNFHSHLTRKKVSGKLRCENLLCMLHPLCWPGIEGYRGWANGLLLTFFFFFFGGGGGRDRLLVADADIFHHTRHRSQQCSEPANNSAPLSRSCYVHMLINSQGKNVACVAPRSTHGSIMNNQLPMRVIKIVRVAVLSFFKHLIQFS